MQLGESANDGMDIVKLVYYTLRGAIKRANV